MEPPLSVQLERISDGVYAFCPELDIHASGSDEQSATDRLAGMIADYFALLLESPDLRQQSPHKEHYEMLVQKVMPFIYEMEKNEQHGEDSAGFRQHVSGLIRRTGLEEKSPHIRH